MSFPDIPRVDSPGRERVWQIHRRPDGAHRGRNLRITREVSLGSLHSFNFKLFCLAIVQAFGSNIFILTMWVSEKYVGTKKRSNVVSGQLYLYFKFLNYIIPTRL